MLFCFSAGRPASASIRHLTQKPFFIPFQLWGHKPAGVGGLTSPARTPAATTRRASCRAARTGSRSSHAGRTRRRRRAFRGLNTRLAIFHCINNRICVPARDRPACHCQARSAAAIQSGVSGSGLLRLRLAMTTKARWQRDLMLRDASSGLLSRRLQCPCPHPEEARSAVSKAKVARRRCRTILKCSIPASPCRRGGAGRRRSSPSRGMSRRNRRESPLSPRPDRPSSGR